MECYCDYEPARVYQKALHKARVEHKCSECGRKIARGEKYEKVFGIWDEGPQVFCTCPHCLELRDFVVAHVPCSCWAHGNMIETVIEDALEYAHEAPGLLFGAYRRQVRILRAKKSSNARGEPREASDSTALLGDLEGKHG